MMQVDELRIRETDTCWNLDNISYFTFFSHIKILDSLRPSIVQFPVGAHRRRLDCFERCCLKILFFF